MAGHLFPRMYRIRQEFDLPAVNDIPAAVRDEIERLGLSSDIKKGDTVAVTAGSRSITEIVTILRTVIGVLADLGAIPFVIPAMGSHGGGTAEGQVELLRRYGITEESVGCPVCSSKETVNLGITDLGFPVLIDRIAYEADHIVVLNRVKPHTRFTAPVESGLVKMCLIGLGKTEGARIYHRAIDRFGWRDVYSQSFRILSENTRLLFGLALIENAHKKIGSIAALRPDRFLIDEPLLLSSARSMMAGIPVADIDLLVVDEMGKDISGTGMDTNVTGRKDGHSSIARCIFVRDLSAKAGGNSLGIGLTDFTTKRLVDKIDHHAMYLNARTAYRTDACKIPMTFESDIEAIEASAFMCGIVDPAQFRVVWIRNTLELDTFHVSEACIHDVKKNRSLAIETGPIDIFTDPDNNLLTPHL